MPMYQRRRPTPVLIVPREDPKPSDASNPKSPGTPSGAPPSPKSPDKSDSPKASSTQEKQDSPSPTATSFPGSAKPSSPTATAAPSIASESTKPTITSQAVASASSTASSKAPGSSSQSTTISSQQKTQASTSTKAPTSTQAPASTQPSASIQPPASTQPPTLTQAPDPVNTNTGLVPDTNVSSNIASVLPSATSIAPSQPTESTASGTARAGLDQTLPEKQAQHQARKLSMGAEAALITGSIIAAVALIVGAIIMMKRRRRRTYEQNHRHTEDAWDPSNNGSLHTPETVHVNMQGGGSHLTTSSTNTEGIFAADEYARPETVSTNSSNSRIQPPQPTPNPFADPSLNKAYDVLRGRPRSTTLTDRGSWVDNPFKDPISERFDPFGELKEKARMERIRYMQELRRDEAQLRREQEMLEKERMGLGPPMTRRGSGVTVEGVGILDRSGDGRGARR